jgi:hypothetical protein
MPGVPQITGSGIPRSPWQTLTVDEHEGSSDRPMLDLSALIGLPADDAVAIAEGAGYRDVRVLEFVGDRLTGAMDMSFRPDRLNLEVEHGRVRRSVLGG